jgi:signal transduction histidine kinase
VSAGLAIGGGALGLLNFLGYLYGVPKLYGIAATTQMAVHTAIGLMLLSSSTMMAWTERGPMSTTVADGPGGAFARLLIPIAVAVPALLGLACVQAQRHGWLGPELGVGLLVLLIVFPMVGFVWGVAAHVQAVDDARRRDAEELARLAAALSDRSRELELANRELESFNYSASHDLRAPLRAIDGFSRVVHDRYANLLDAEGRGYLERVRANAQRMGQIIDDLLRLSRLSRQELHVAEVDLAELARAVVGRLREAEPTRSVGVRIPDRVPAHGDLSLLDVALQNLLGNAWKFTGTKAEARIEFGVGSRGGHAAFFVRDDGAGFDPGYAARLFQPFQRLHSAAEFPGTGIGLATVQRIVHRHGGEVWAEGKPGEGATFWFTLPGSEGAAP